jgi:hypothetical protein
MTKARPRAHACLPRAGAVFLTVAALTALGITSPAPTALAQTYYNCKSPHCYDIGQAVNDYAGIEGQWTDEPITMPSSEVQDGYHLSNELWLTMSNGQWVEEGLAVGCTEIVPLGDTCSGIGGSDAYMQFWADEGVSNYYFHPIDTLSADGTSHSYEIWDSSDGANDDFNVYLDYNLINTSTVQHTSTGSSLQAGMELYSPGINSSEYTSSSTTAFQNYTEVYLNSQGYWRYVIFDPDTVHSSCTVSDDCAEDDCSDFGYGYCLWWSRESSYDWADSKPAAPAIAKPGTVASAGSAPASGAAGRSRGVASGHAAPSHTMSRAMVACERAHAVCDPAALRRFPLLKPDAAGARLLTESQVLRRSAWSAGDTAGATLMTYGAAAARYPALAADTGVVSAKRLVWLVTVYFSKPVNEPYAGGYGPQGRASTMKISRESAVIDAATGQVTDSCLGCAAAAASAGATRLAALTH